MELRHLRYFVKVAELGNFTRAAEYWGVSQPSLSQQIINLEHELGETLFERLGRKVLLTDAGRALYDHAGQILAAVDEAQRRVSEAGHDGKGRLVIGAIPTVAPYLLPAVLAEFLADYPQAEVVVQENVTEPTVQACLAGDLDLAVAALPLERDQLHVEPLFQEELFLVLPVGHPLARRKRLAVDDLRGEPFIVLHEEHCLGDQLLRFCRQNDFQPLASCRSAQLLTVQELVALGRGVSLIPAMARAIDDSEKRVYRSLSSPTPTRTLALLWREHRFQGPLVRECIQRLRRLKGR